MSDFFFMERFFVFENWVFLLGLCLIKNLLLLQLLLEILIMLLDNLYLCVLLSYLLRIVIPHYFDLFIQFLNLFILGINQLLQFSFFLFVGLIGFLFLSCLPQKFWRGHVNSCIHRGLSLFFSHQQLINLKLKFWYSFVKIQCFKVKSFSHLIFLLKLLMQFLPVSISNLSLFIKLILQPFKLSLIKILQSFDICLT